MDYAGAYIRLGQFDEAVKVLESMPSDKYIQMMQQDTGEFSNEWIQQQISEVKKMKQEAANKDTYTQTDTYTQPKATVVDQPVKQTVEPKKAGEPKAADEVPAPDNNVMLWWLLGGGVLLLGLIGLFMRRKQS
ncbi:MAG: hypothetical protein Q9N62_03630 [Ghiorsea sp.]|nr:hypothetical protein [Ghiorsea sp.]